MLSSDPKLSPTEKLGRLLECQTERHAGTAIAIQSCFIAGPADADIDPHEIIQRLGTLQRDAAILAFARHRQLELIVE